MKKAVFELMIIFVVMVNTSFLLSCQSNRTPLPGETEIVWEVISNTHNERPAVKAAFYITNQSNFTFLEDNWALYYNQSPRSVLAVDEDARVSVEHINGDWFRIVPREGFMLEPGEKVAIQYESENWWIKESDAPAGLYFVFQGLRNKESIVPVENYKVLPFERPEQYTRHHGDQEPFPSAEINYYNNKVLSVLPEQELLKVIPTPYYITTEEEIAIFDREPVIYYVDGLAFEANYLKEIIEDICNCTVQVRQGYSPSNFSINLMMEELEVGGKTDEAYHLEINAEPVINISGSDAAGVFYAIQTLVSLAKPEALAKATVPVQLPVTRIKDAPRFGYRGVHVDVSRNFQTIEALEKTIDILSYYKINTLHLHLTDDEGWRLEIPSLPELTQVGAHRGHTTKDAPALHPAYGSGPFHAMEGRFGSGYYTKDEFIGLLKYAKSRHVRVIPEINLPGHARAAIKAMEARYERFMEKGDVDGAEEFRLIDPEETSRYVSAQFFSDNVVNVARESTYRFFETVLDELISMYNEAAMPLEILHVGGDEVPGGAWTASPMIDEKMATLPHIHKPANMHAYFTERALEILKRRNIKMAGWEEVALKEIEGGAHVPNMQFSGGDVIPFVWNNLWGAQDLAYRLANRGFPVVLCHVTAFYFDLAYNKDPREPGLYWAGFVDTKNSWHYNPYDVFQTTTRDNMGRLIDVATEYMGMERLHYSARENILGVQAQLWSETIQGQDMLEYYLLPRLIGFAESAWSPERNWEQWAKGGAYTREVNRQWNVFANTLAVRQLPVLAHIFGGFNYRVPPPGAIWQNGKLYANSAYPGLIIRYTTDGSEPGMNATVYKGPVEINASMIRLKAFDTEGGQSLTVDLRSEIIE